jgi:hypothetical protein
MQKPKGDGLKAEGATRVIRGMRGEAQKKGIRSKPAEETKHSTQKEETKVLDYNTDGGGRARVTGGGGEEGSARESQRWRWMVEKVCVIREQHETETANC